MLLELSDILGLTLEAPEGPPVDIEQLRQLLISASNGLIEAGLTPTEMKVLRFILDGKSNKEIADLRHCHIRTIEFHRRNFYHKLGVDNLLDLIRRAAEMGLFELPQNAG